MTTGELIKVLADYCPDTPVKVPLAPGVLYEIVANDYEYDEPGTLSLFISDGLPT